MHRPVVPGHLAAVRPADTTSRAGACPPARSSTSGRGPPVHSAVLTAPRLPRAGHATADAAASALLLRFTLCESALSGAVDRVLVFQPADLTKEWADDVRELAGVLVVGGVRARRSNDIHA